ncbi:Zinc finger BED domain-containing protein RICESLEEPER 3 [Sesamum angolense]|uniref:Zinc finger BED domain-containing protein RICESLEEPER 3 n=1 Tax=Sesamum angolense TaxID=2727404 RepID=A0AAE1T8N1_9LAMI|nr:Zinc finger BED domain-containing protein RICESLEEPER 3 [Sesamum angolense]
MSSPVDNNINVDESIDEFEEFVVSRTTSATNVPMTLELDIYLEESLLPRARSFDILNLWKTNGVKFPTLQKMARDILAIPISTIAFDPKRIDSKLLTKEEVEEEMRAFQVRQNLPGKAVRRLHSTEVHGTIPARRNGKAFASIWCRTKPRCYRLPKHREADRWVAAIKIAATTLELDEENFIKLVELSLEGFVKIGWDNTPADTKASIFAGDSKSAIADRLGRPIKIHFIGDGYFEGSRQKRLENMHKLSLALN